MSDFFRRKNGENDIVREEERGGHVTEKDKVKVELLTPGRKDIKFKETSNYCQCVT